MWIVILPKFRLSQVDLWQAVFSVYVLPAKMLENAVTPIFASVLWSRLFLSLFFDIRRSARLNSLPHKLHFELFLPLLKNHGIS